MPSRALRGISKIITGSQIPAIIFSLGFAFQSFAADTGVTPITDTKSAHSAICNVFSFMFWTLLSISIIMVLWAAYLYATAQDDVEKTSQARRTILYAAVGIVVALLGKGFPLIVAGIFPNGTQGINGC